MTHGHFCGCLRFSFAELKKPAIYIFFRNLHLLSFPTLYSLPCFPLKWRAYEFFSPRTPAKVWSNLKLLLARRVVCEPMKFSQLMLQEKLYVSVVSTVTLILPACLDDEKRDHLDGNFRTCLTIHPSRIRLWKKTYGNY